MFAESNESLFYKDADAQIMFRQDAEGNYVHLIINQGGVGTYACRAGTAPKVKEDKTPPIE